MTQPQLSVTVRAMLRHLLEAYSLSVREAARRAGISPTAVQRYVGGSKPSRVNAGKMAELFDPQDSARLLHEWGFSLAAEKQTHDAEVANGWRLESILGELRNLRKNQVSQLDLMQKMLNALAPPSFGVTQRFDVAGDPRKIVDQINEIGDGE